MKAKAIFLHFGVIEVIVQFIDKYILKNIFCKMTF